MASSQSSASQLQKVAQKGKLSQTLPTEKRHRENALLVSRNMKEIHFVPPLVNQFQDFTGMLHNKLGGHTGESNFF